MLAAQPERQSQVVGAFDPAHPFVRRRRLRPADRQAALAQQANHAQSAKVERELGHQRHQEPPVELDITLQRRNQHAGRRRQHVIQILEQWHQERIVGHVRRDQARAGPGSNAMQLCDALEFVGFPAQQLAEQRPGGALVTLRIDRDQRGLDRQQLRVEVDADCDARHGPHFLAQRRQLGRQHPEILIRLDGIQQAPQPQQAFGRDGAAGLPEDVAQSLDAIDIHLQFAQAAQGLMQHALLQSMRIDVVCELDDAGQQVLDALRQLGAAQQIVQDFLPVDDDCRIAAQLEEDRPDPIGVTGIDAQ